MAGAELTAPATRALVARAGQATSLVEVHRLVAELGTLPGVRDAALATVTELPPGSVSGLLAPVGPPTWRLALRVRARDASAHDRVRPAVAELATAAERCLALPCRAQPAQRWTSADPLARHLVTADRAVVVVVDPAVGWTALSEAFDLVLGYDRQAPPDVSPLDLIHPDDHAVAVASFVDACAGRAAGAPFDLRVRAANGRWRTLEVVVRPGDGVVAYLGLDVTAVRADERELHAELARVRAAGTDGDSTFVPTVAHELRGPLSSVVAFAHLLGDPAGGELTEDQRTYLDVIDRNANRLLRLIEDLLLLSRLQSGRLPLQPAPVRVPALVEPVIADNEDAARAAGVTLGWDCADGPELVCDEARIQQVLANLVGNALKFTPAGGRIDVSAAPAGGGWRLAVADTGVGIPAAEQPRLFSPFFRASNAAARTGTPGAGLGLLISRAIVELHGGTIEVASTEGVGTTVTVSLSPQQSSTNHGG